MVNKTRIDEREILDRKQEVINACLEKLVAKGLYGTSVRDLSKSLHLQSGGLYYYFKNKDEAIIACAEEAAIRLEKDLFLAALNDTDNPERLMANLRANADKMAPTMRFFAQVCATPEYREQMRPALNRLSERYKSYAAKFSKKLGQDYEVVEPYVYMCITAASNYMIFGGESYIAPQMELIKDKLISLSKRKI